MLNGNEGNKMKNMDKATALLFETLTSLVNVRKEELTIEQQELIVGAIDNLEEIRGLLYAIKNELNLDIS